MYREGKFAQTNIAVQTRTVGLSPKHVTRNKQNEYPAMKAKQPYKYYCFEQ